MKIGDKKWNVAEFISLVIPLFMAAEIWLLRMEFTILGPFGITDEQFWEVYALGQFNGVINVCVF